MTWIYPCHTFPTEIEVILHNITSNVGFRLTLCGFLWTHQLNWIQLSLIINAFTDYLHSYYQIPNKMMLTVFIWAKDETMTTNFNQRECHWWNIFHIHPTRCDWYWGISNYQKNSSCMVNCYHCILGGQIKREIILWLDFRLIIQFDILEW